MTTRQHVSICAIAAVILTAVCSLGLTWWWTAQPESRAELRLALPIPAQLSTAVKVDIKGFFKQSSGTPSELTAQWPGFRGPNRDNICPDDKPLADTWPEAGPPLLWALDVGDGYAGPAVINGRVYILDYDESEGADSLRCLSLDDGSEIWRRWYKIKVKRNHGMSRTVPAVTDKYVVTLGPKCQVMCADAISGDFIWGLDLPSVYGTQVPLWYAGQCPLIDNGQAVIATGGKALMIGVDLATGEVAWSTPNPKNWQMSHSSITPMTLLGKQMFIYCAAGALTAVSAEPEDRGALLWSTTVWNPSVMSPSPVKIADNRILVTAGYGSGSMILELVLNAGTYSMMPSIELKRSEFACEQHTPIFYKDHLFTILPGDGGAFKKMAVCMKTDGTIAWRSGTENRFGLGPFLIADNKLFILNDDGELTMLQASTDSYRELAQHKVLDGHDAWGPMALVDGRLLLRDFEKFICIDLRDGSETL
jgi:outer membrane protein assembly factor BamB